MIRYSESPREKKTSVCPFKGYHGHVVDAGQCSGMTREIFVKSTGIGENRIFWHYIKLSSQFVSMFGFKHANEKNWSKPTRQNKIKK